MSNIQDFGEKIGGARKDMWRSRGLIVSDLDEMSEKERSDNIRRDNIWIKPNWEEHIASGIPRGLAYWQNLVRISIPPQPPKYADKKQQEAYVRVIGEIRDAVMSLKDINEIDRFYRDVFCTKYIVNERSLNPDVNFLFYGGHKKTSFNRIIQQYSGRMEREANEKLFGVPKDKEVYQKTKNRLEVYQYDGDNVSFSKDEYYVGERATLTIKSGFGRSYYYLNDNDAFSDVSAWGKDTYFILNSSTRKPLEINFNSREDAENFVEQYALGKQEEWNNASPDKDSGSKSNRKKNFTPPQLSHINRVGPDYRNGVKASADMFLNDLNFRGGEFGNWLNAADRQTSLDMAYDAFRDLSRILKIDLNDISFDKSLSIAFGSRGRGGANAAAAHFEPGKQVINLTKLSGAGCLAHEWGHALDYAIADALNFPGDFASESRFRSDLKSLKELMYSIKHKEGIVTAKEISDSHLGKVKYNKSNLEGWIDSVKPSNLDQGFTEEWNAAKKRILDCPEAFSGHEYFVYRRGEEVATNPDVEILSRISKIFTNHVIKRDAKHQIALWARELAKINEKINSARDEVRTIHTDYYKDSAEFDEIHSKSAHGYWKSECELFARAFDCYIADKLKENGEQSDYLSGHSDSFISTGRDGNPIYAFPRGEERRVINENFDKLFEELKERGILHDYVEEIEMVVEEPVVESEPDKLTDFDFNRSEKYEQLSFEDLLFSAQQRAEAQVAASRAVGKNKSFSR